MTDKIDDKDVYTFVDEETLDGGSEQASSFNSSEEDQNQEDVFTDDIEIESNSDHEVPEMTEEKWYKKIPIDTLFPNKRIAVVGVVFVGLGLFFTVYNKINHNQSSSRSMDRSAESTVIAEPTEPKSFDDVQATRPAPTVNRDIQNIKPNRDQEHREQVLTLRDKLRDQKKDYEKQLKELQVNFESAQKQNQAM